MKGVPHNEAKNYVCPQTLSNLNSDKCIGKSCMAWRKSGSMAKDYEGRYVDRDLTGKGWIEFGYCGLAGSIEKE